MSYTLKQFAADCHSAMSEDTGKGGREKIRQYVAKACSDAEFVATHLGPDNTTERQIIYQDDEFGFCILAHAYNGAKQSSPHDHASTWAIYGQADGTTLMTDWEAVEPPRDGKPGKVKAVRNYQLNPGDAHIYHEGDLHSPAREDSTRLIRIEGMNMTGVKRDSFVAI